MDLGGGFATCVGNDAVVGAGVIEANGLAGSGKRIDDGGTTKSKGIDGERNVLARRGVEEEKDVQINDRQIAIEAGEIEEEELLGEPEVLLQNAVGRMGLSGIRNDVVVGAKADGPEARQRKGGETVSGPVVENDAGGVAEQQLVEQTSDVAGGVEMKTKASEFEVGEGSASGFEAEAQDAGGL